MPLRPQASAAVALGATVAASQLHSNSRVPKSCIVSAIVGSATIATALAHHGSLSKTPAWYCVAGGAAGVVGVGYALSAHTEISKVLTWIAISLLPARLLSYNPRTSPRRAGTQNVGLTRLRVCAQIPTECKVYTACALALIIGGAAMLGKK